MCACTYIEIRHGCCSPHPPLTSRSWSLTGGGGPPGTAAAAAAAAAMALVLRLAADLLDRDQPGLLEGALEVRGGCVRDCRGAPRRPAQSTCSSSSVPAQPTDAGPRARAPDRDAAAPPGAPSRQGVRAFLSGMDAIDDRMSPLGS